MLRQRSVSQSLAMNLAHQTHHALRIRSLVSGVAIRKLDQVAVKVIRADVVVRSADRPFELGKEVLCFVRSV